jgi:hypothetical protein
MTCQRVEDLYDSCFVNIKDLQQQEQQWLQQQLHQQCLPGKDALVLLDLHNHYTKSALHVRWVATNSVLGPESWHPSARPISSLASVNMSSKLCK